MRISARKGDPSYNYRAHDYQVTLDGELLLDCFTADEESGEAHCYVVDSDGRCVLNDQSSRLKEVVKKGKVVVTFQEAGLRT